MGEPLANYKRVVAAVRRITEPAPAGLGISQRSVTVSTVGLAPAIRKLADEKMQVRLAVSLHTPDDELRDTLVPVNNRWSVDEVLSAARYYADTSGRRVSIEYALIRDINDQPWRAELLAKRLRNHLGQLVHVNVIPLNPTPGSKWDASPKPVEREFVRLVCATRAARRSPRRVGSWPLKAEFPSSDGEFVVMYAPSLLDPAAESLKLGDFSGATEVAREARTLLGEQFSSVTFMYVLMRAFEVEYNAACDASRWHEFHGGPRALSDADLEKLLAPWLDR